MGAVLILAALCITSHSMTVEEFMALPVPENVSDLKGQAFVDFINRNQPFYKAEVPKMSYENFQSRLMDLKYLEKPAGAKTADELVASVVIPERFDAREKWPYCDSIKQIRDQGWCGSCWVVSAASAMSDKLCVQSYGAMKTIISEADILECCGSYCGHGCDGGYPIKAWYYTQSSGVCSGGPYNAKNCCKPYPFRPTGVHAGHPYSGGKDKGEIATPACYKSCQAGYPTPYDKDKIYACKAYYLPQSEREIQIEIMTNGPVQASLKVYEDFDYYRSGVYVHKYGKLRGGHAVKIIGWGVASGSKYWLISNSWNSTWGDKGLVKVLRGSNHCNIEEHVIGGIMKVITRPDVIRKYCTT